MLNTLPDSIIRMSSSSRSTVSSLIREMKANKSDVQSLISTLSTYSSTSTFAAEKVAPLSVLSREILVDMFRDTYLRIRELFSRANAAGLIINSMIDIFSSEIDKVENDIKDLELFINNYEFLSGKDDYFNFNYLEKFDNALNSSAYDTFPFSVPDRDGTVFPEGGNGFVDSIYGAFKMGTGSNKVNVLNNIRSFNVVTNYSNYITSESSFDNVINDLEKDAWSTTIKSPSIIKNDLLQYGEYFDFNSNETTGAQAAVELEFSSSVKMDTIRVKPIHGNSLKLLQVVIFTDDTSLEENSGVDYTEQYHKCLAQPRFLDTIVDVHFPEAIVRKVIFLFNQPAYVRSNPVSLSSELNSKQLQNFVNRRMAERSNSFSEIQDIVFFLFRRKNTIRGLETFRKSQYDYYSYKFPQNPDSYLNQIKDELFTINNTDFTDRPAFAGSAIFADLVSSVSFILDQDGTLIKDSIFIDSSRNLNSRATSIGSLLPRSNANLSFQIQNQFYSQPLDNGTYKDAARMLGAADKSESYEYSFAIGSIDFYATQTRDVDKACFVSKRISSDGQIAAVKAKVKKLLVENSDNIAGYDIEELFSQELSVSNRQNPSAESDWVPILSYDQKQVTSEVVFFDTTNLYCNLRFRATPNSILLYENGMVIPTSKYQYVYANNRLYITDLDVFNPLSTWCVSYTPDLSTIDPYQIDFERYGLFKDLSKRYYGPEGSGQKFYGTGGDRTVDLDYAPYINQAYTQESSYNETTGTIFYGSGSGYSPIVVKLSDGSIATNMTNYTKQPQKVVFPTSAGTFYIQSGRKIIFNTIIEDEITVEYEYIPNDTRFRLILRKNTQNTISGGIDSVLLKMKVVNYNPYYDKLKSISVI